MEKLFLAICRKHAKLTETKRERIIVSIFYSVLFILFFTTIVIWPFIMVILPIIILICIFIAVTTNIIEWIKEGK